MIGNILFSTAGSCRVGPQSVCGECDCMTCDLSLSPVFTSQEKLFEPGYTVLMSMHTVYKLGYHDSLQSKHFNKYLSGAHLFILFNMSSTFSMTLI